MSPSEETSETALISATIQAGDYLRYLTLFTAFDGDPDNWLSALPLSETSPWISADRRFLEWIKEQMATNPTFLSEVRPVVRAAEELLSTLPPVMTTC